MTTTSNEITTNAENGDWWYGDFNIQDDLNHFQRKDVNIFTPILRAKQRQTDTREWAEEIVNGVINPDSTNSTVEQRNVADLCDRLARSLRGRSNSLGNSATDEEINDPRAISLMMLRLDAESDFRCLFKQDIRVARNLGELHLDLPDNKVLLRANGRFGSDGGYLQDVWSALALLRTTGVLPQHLQAFANAMYYAVRDRRNIRKDD